MCNGGILKVVCIAIFAVVVLKQQTLSVDFGRNRKWFFSTLLGEGWGRHYLFVVGDKYERWVEGIYGVSSVSRGIHTTDDSNSEQ